MRSDKMSTAQRLSGHHDTRTPSPRRVEERLLVWGMPTGRKRRMPVTAGKPHTMVYSQRRYAEPAERPAMVIHSGTTVASNIT
jgi:hypothetical protein